MSIDSTHAPRTATMTAIALIFLHGCLSLPGQAPMADGNVTDLETQASEVGMTDGVADAATEAQDAPADALQDATAEDASNEDASADGGFVGPGYPWSYRFELSYWGALHLVITRSTTGDSSAFGACGSAIAMLSGGDEICWRESCGAKSAWAKYDEESDAGPESVSLLEPDPAYRYWIWLYAPADSGTSNAGGKPGFLNLWWHGLLAFQMASSPTPEPFPLEPGSIYLFGVLEAGESPLHLAKLRTCSGSDEAVPCSVDPTAQLDGYCHRACVAPVASLPGALTPVACTPAP